MKKSELRNYIRETILQKLEEVTIEAPKNDPEAIKKAKEAAEDDDVVSVYEEESSKKKA